MAVKKWLAVVSVIVVLVGATGIVLHQRSVDQRARDRRAALVVGAVQRRTEDPQVGRLETTSSLAHGVPAKGQSG